MTVKTGRVAAIIALLLPLSQLSYGAGVATYFNKNWDHQLFLEQAPLSRKQLLLRLQGLGIAVFSADGERGVPSPPPEVAKEWKARVQHNRANQHPLYAVYWPKDWKFDGSNERPRDTLVITREASAPVLLHEFLHYLFQRARASQPAYVALDAITRKKAGTMSRFELAYGASKQKPEEFRSASEDLIDTTLELLSRSSIEEAVIGLLLVKASKEGSLVLSKSEKAEHCGHALENTDLAGKPFQAFSRVFEKMGSSGDAPHLEQPLKKLSAIHGQLEQLKGELSALCR